MESLDVQEWTRIGAMNQRDQQSRAGVSPARVGEADAPLTLARSPGRRDACPTLLVAQVHGPDARPFLDVEATHEPRLAGAPPFRRLSSLWPVVRQTSNQPLWKGSVRLS